MLFWFLISLILASFLFLWANHGIELAFLSYFIMGMLFWLFSYAVAVKNKDKEKVEHFNKYTFSSIMIYSFFWLFQMLISSPEKDSNNV